MEKRACPMRCLVCGAEMHVEQVAPDDTMPVCGYEHRTLKCPQCGDTERRLVFVADRTSAESTSVETTIPVVEPTIPVVEPTILVAETTIPVAETTIPVAEPTIPVRRARQSQSSNRRIASRRNRQSRSSKRETLLPDRGQDQPGVAPDAGGGRRKVGAGRREGPQRVAPALAQAVAAEKPAKAPGRETRRRTISIGCGTALSPRAKSLRPERAITVPAPRRNSPWNRPAGPKAWRAPAGDTTRHSCR